MKPYKLFTFALILFSSIMTAQDIELPSPIKTGGMPLMEALERRSTARDFSSQKIDPQTLSNLLWAAWGYNRGNSSKRTAPSSHNRQETEIYAALETGTYYYNAKENLLEMVLAEDIRSLTGMQNFVEKAPVNLIFVSDISKITGKDERGTVETAYVNTGFISQNVYLFCASAGLSTVTRAMVDKSALAEKLGFGKHHVITLVQTVGWPASRKSINVPFVESLEKLPYEQLRGTLKEKGSTGAIDVINWPKYSYCPGVSFCIARSKEYLFVSYLVNEKSIRAVNDKDNGPVHQDSCVEFFLQIPGEKEYYNFETNCIGTLHAAKRQSRSEPARFSQDTLDKVIRYTSLERKPFEEKFAPEGFKYNVIIGIPWEVLSLDPDNLPDKIMANFYKCGDNLSEPHYLSWNPIRIEKPNFHRPDYFGELILK